jgi:predicted DNA-binding protein
MPEKSGMKRVLKNLHVPMPEPLHRRLRGAAERLGTPATAVARRAIEDWLEENERIAVHEAVADYARSAAGSPADLDRVLERAAAEHLFVRRPKKPK